MNLLCWSCQDLMWLFLELILSPYFDQVAANKNGFVLEHCNIYIEVFLYNMVHNKMISDITQMLYQRTCSLVKEEYLMIILEYFFNFSIDTFCGYSLESTSFLYMSSDYSQTNKNVNYNTPPLSCCAGR